MHMQPERIFEATLHRQLVPADGLSPATTARLASANNGEVGEIDRARQLVSLNYNLTRALARSITPMERMAIGSKSCS
jgi:hypothetical protein